MAKPIVYIDMDGTLVDFKGFFDELAAAGEIVPEPLDAHLEVFALARPMADAIAAVGVLSAHFDLHILTTSPWGNPAAPSQKLAWIKQHFGDQPESPFYKKVIISHQKHLNHGDYLIDDRAHPRFTGVQILFGKTSHPELVAIPNWQEVSDFLLAKHDLPTVDLATFQAPN